MKKLFAALSICCIIANCHSQTILSTETKLFIKDYNYSVEKNSEKALIDFYGKYPVYKTNSQLYISCLALANSKFSKLKTESNGILVGSETGNIVTLRVPFDKINHLNNLPGITYLEIAGKIKPHLDKAVKDTRVDSVWKSIGLPIPFSGKNVLIGITDWGFDYTNPMFYDTTLSHTRIFKAWDQYRQSGPPPPGSSYGTEISGESNLLNAQCDTFNVYQWATHGTHVAGICAGSGAGTVYRGVAYESEFLMTSILVDAAAVLDAYNWMYNTALAEGKRLVINQSWGLYWVGTLDGTSLLSQAIDYLSGLGVVFVSSGGNNGDVNFHLKHTFSVNSDTVKTIIGFDNYAYYSNMWGQSVTIWGTPGEQFKLQLRVLNNSNQVLGQSSFFATNDTNQYQQGYITTGSDTVFYNLSCDSVNILNQRPHMRLRVRNLQTSTKKVAMYLTSPAGTIHCWNLIELTNDVGNWGSAFIAPGAGWKAGDYYSGIGEPSCTNSVISVAAHLSETVLPNGNITGGTIATFSSYGPTYDGRLKPDISAPGQSVCSSVSSFTNQSLSGMVTSVNFNGRTYKFYRFSGTSMSSPMVTGIVALMLQANPSLTPADIKEIIKVTAREDIKTGDIPDTGSYRWGWGKIHAWKAVKMAYASVDEKTMPNSVLVYPNPALKTIYFLGEHPGEVLSVSVYSLLGSEVLPEQLITDGKMDISRLNSGIYLLKINNGNQLFTLKLMVGH